MNLVQRRLAVAEIYAEWWTVPFDNWPQHKFKVPHGGHKAVAKRTFSSMLGRGMIGKAMMLVTVVLRNGLRTLKTQDAGSQADKFDNVNCTWVRHKYRTQL